MTNTLPNSMIRVLVLGPMLESSLRRSLMMSDGNPMIFLKRPISAVFLVVALIFLISSLFTRERIGMKTRKFRTAWSARKWRDGDDIY